MLRIMLHILLILALIIAVTLYPRPKRKHTYPNNPPNVDIIEIEMYRAYLELKATTDKFNRMEPTDVSRAYMTLFYRQWKEQER